MPGIIIIPKTLPERKIKVVGIGKGLKTKVNVNIGTSTLYQNLEKVLKAVAMKYGADTSGPFRWRGSDLIRKSYNPPSVTFGSCQFMAYGHGVVKYKNPLNMWRMTF
ncbi:MAG: phosphomethylpyrimidine synthase ThiC [Candidatus Nitrosocosmicus sp.]